MQVIKGKPVYTVTEVNTLARETLEQMSFWIEGEVSSFKGLNTHYRWLYFDLKDANTGYKISCIMDPESFHGLNFEMEDGQKIIALGNFTLWEKEARFQLFVHKVESFGEGSLLAQIEELKRKLAAKGYFDAEFKKALPAYPMNIAVVTSLTSDAWHDFKRHSIEKFPILKLTVFDVKVQGQTCLGQVVQAIKRADKLNFDAIAIIRGGGSIEDLESYSREELAETIFAAKTPTIVGVGHEKDICIAQLVADMAASTPTDAAKILTANYVNLEEKLEQILFSIQKIVTAQFAADESKVHELRHELERSTEHLYRGNSQTLDIVFHKLALQREFLEKYPHKLESINQRLLNLKNTIILKNEQKTEMIKASMFNSWLLKSQQYTHTLEKMENKLNLLSPKNILERGYSMATDENNKIIKDASTLVLGTTIKVKFARGKALSKVTKVEE